MLGLVITAFSAVSAFAQTTTPNPCEDYDAKTASYEKFRAGFKASPRTLEKAKSAIAAGDDFLSKYGTCEGDKPVIDYITKNLPELKEYVKLQELYVRFDASIADPKNVNADQAYSSGKEIMALKPDLSLDVAIVLASIAFDSSIKNPPVDKYNADGITYAKKAIKDIESGKTSKCYGAKAYCLAQLDAKKAIDPVKSKQNALGSLNYIIASITYYNQKMKKDAVPYFYQTTKFESTFKKDPELYRAIGAWYLEELLEIDKKRLAAITANGEKDNAETLAMFALEKGYADRGIDAYARAHALAKASPTAKPDYVKALYEKIQALYKLRFDKETGIDAYVATVVNQPMPDPTTAVTPVVDATPTGTTTGTATPGTTTPNTTKPAADTPPTKPATTKPAADTPTKPAATTKPPTSSKSKTVVKSKTATTKKKGTR